MSDGPSHNLGGLDIDLARRIEEVCRRFEADWRERRRPRVENYLGDVPDEGHPALRAELSALERELRQSEETVARPEADPPTPSEPRTAPNPSTIAEPSTIALGPPPTTPILGVAALSVRDEATVPPGNTPRSAHEQPTAVVLGQEPSATPGASEPTRIRVALKMILAGQLANETDVKRFYSEAEAAANLDHPEIVPIFEVGQHDGQHYFSMGFVEGQRLSELLAAGPLPPRQAAALMVKVAEAIAYAHSRGVIHRDLKPANILLDQAGNPRVTDFDLPKKLQGDSGLTGSGQIMGTPSYMPPKQARGNRREVGPAADVYALGATLYALITGRPPFQASTAMDTVLQVIHDEPVPPRRLNPSVPRDLETSILKCLEKESGPRLAARRAGQPGCLAKQAHRAQGALLASGRVSAVACSPNGTVVLTGSQDKTVRLWNAATGESIGPLLAHQGPVKAVAFSPDGRIVLTGRDDNTARLWDATTGKPIGPPLAHQDAVRAVAFSPDDKTLLTGSSDKTARLWDAANGMPIGAALVHQGEVSAAAFSPNGKLVLTGSDDRTARVWDAASGAPIGPPLAHKGAVRAVAFTRDGTAVLTGSTDKTARVWAITALPDDLPRLTTWVEHFTGLEVDGQGRVRALDNAAWRQRRERLNREGGPPESGLRWRLDPIVFVRSAG
jgi:serine/threonine protein kinase